MVCWLLSGCRPGSVFWLPLGLERDAVNLSTLVGEGSHYDFSTIFLTVRDLLEPSRGLGWGASEPLYNYNLGVVQWVLGGVGVVLWFGQRKYAVAAHGLFVSALASSFFSCSPYQTSCGKLCRSCRSCSFPWRLLGAALCHAGRIVGCSDGCIADALLAGPDESNCGLRRSLSARHCSLHCRSARCVRGSSFGGTEPVDGLNIRLTGRWLGNDIDGRFCAIYSRGRATRGPCSRRLFLERRCH